MSVTASNVSYEANASSLASRECCERCFSRHDDLEQSALSSPSAGTAESDEPVCFFNIPDLPEERLCGFNIHRDQHQRRYAFVFNTTSGLNRPVPCSGTLIGHVVNRFFGHRSNGIVHRGRTLRRPTNFKTFQLDELLPQLGSKTILTCVAGDRVSSATPPEILVGVNKSRPFSLAVQVKGSGEFEISDVSISARYLGRRGEPSLPTPGQAMSEYLAAAETMSEVGFWSDWEGDRRIPDHLSDDMARGLDQYACMHATTGLDIEMFLAALSFPKVSTPPLAILVVERIVQKQPAPINISVTIGGYKVPSSSLVCLTYYDNFLHECAHSDDAARCLVIDRPGHGRQHLLPLWTFPEPTVGDAFVLIGRNLDTKDFGACNAIFPSIPYTSDDEEWSDAELSVAESSIGEESDGGTREDDSDDAEYFNSSPVVYTCKSKIPDTPIEFTYAEVVGIEEVLRDGKGELQLINLV